MRLSPAQPEREAHLQNGKSRWADALPLCEGNVSGSGGTIFSKNNITGWACRQGAVSPSAKTDAGHCAMQESCEKLKRLNNEYAEGTFELTKLEQARKLAAVGKQDTRSLDDRIAAAIAKKRRIAKDAFIHRLRHGCGD